MYRSDVPALYEKLSSDDQLKLLLVAADDWATEAGETRLRQRLLTAMDEIPPENVAVVARRRDYDPEEIVRAVTGLIVLGDEPQLRKLAGPLAANLARHAHQRGEDRELLTMLLTQITPSSLAGLTRLAKAMVRPDAPAPARSRQI